jgi:hypothetical protein
MSRKISLHTQTTPANTRESIMLRAVSLIQDRRKNTVSGNTSIGYKKMLIKYYHAEKSMEKVAKPWGFIPLTQMFV